MAPASAEAEVEGPEEEEEEEGGAAVDEAAVDASIGPAASREPPDGR